MRQHLLKNLWRWKVGLEELQNPSQTLDLNDLCKSEWSVRFETLMRNRLVLGAFRYGLINTPNKKKFKRVESMFDRLELFKKTGNKECLVDVANLCLLEFEECHHPNAHFKSIDDGVHTEEV